MLKLVYTPTMQGAPDDFGDAVDTMAVRDEAGAETLLQSFAKAASGFVAPEPALEGCITTWLASRLDRARPVIVMVHGYNFDPEDTHRAGSPFDTVYGLPSAGRPSRLATEIS